MHERGVVYYNGGTSCAVRLLVSLTSLRRHYSGPVTVLSEGEESHRLCERIAVSANADLKEWNSGVEEGVNRHFLAKTRCHVGTPYEISISLDSDTLIAGSTDDLFHEAAVSGFCIAQFSGWRSDGRTIAKRIREWAEFAPDDIEPAIRFGPAINTGVMAFRRSATLFADWYPLALRGRDCFIPDEVSCQILLPRHPHRVLDGRWNRSCKHDNPDAPDTRIIHFHGRKHCRRGLPFHGARWVAEFEAVLRENVAGVREWMPAGDRVLHRHLRAGKSNALESVSPTAHDARAGIRAAILGASEPRIVLGARKTAYDGWISTDKNTLDVTKRSDWQRMLGNMRIHRCLAEHVWEQLTSEEMDAANRLVFEFLQEGGCLRIAVPDGFHPNTEYLAQVRPGGTGVFADDHKQLLNLNTLSDALRLAGFDVAPVEYWDESGVFHYRPWCSEDGHIKRSAFHDRRNRTGRLVYTSLIVDAWKR